MRAVVLAGAVAAVTVAGGSSAQAAVPSTLVFRLGPGEFDHSGVAKPAPKSISALAGIDVVHVSANDDHVLALGSGGDVYAWGNNFTGQLGDGTTRDHAAPVPVPIPAGVGRVIQVSAGYAFSVAVTSSGRVLTWGAFPGDGTDKAHLTPTAITLPHNERARFISTDSDFVEYVTRSGEIWGWGGNFSGQLGNGNLGAPNRPVQARLPAHFVATSVATGIEHTLALGTQTTTGRTQVLAWGNNFDGELGRPGVDHSLVPVVTPFPASAASIVSISAGGVASGAVDARGTAYSWGGNDAIADQMVPTVVPLPAGVRASAIVCGTIFTLVTTSSNQLFGWGLNVYGGLGPDIGATFAVPTHVPLPAGTIVTVAHNLETTYAVLHRP